MSSWMAPPLGHLASTTRFQTRRFQVTLFLILSLWSFMIFYGAYYTQITQEHISIKAQLFYREKRQQHTVGVLTAFHPYEETPLTTKSTLSISYSDNIESLEKKIESELKDTKPTSPGRRIIKKPITVQGDSNRWRQRKSLKFSEQLGVSFENDTGRLKSSVARELSRKKKYETHVKLAIFKGRNETTRKTIAPGQRFDLPRKGEFGQPVIVNTQELNAKEKAAFDWGWKTHHFNEFASLQISVQREVPDFRNSKCQKGARDGDTHLPKASIIICFYNEAWSVLLRSIYSILARSPAHLLQEIILVDDFSDLDSLQKPLQQFVSGVDKLRLLRMRSRSGLVRARLAGVQEAKGDVLVFLDSHVECQKGWLLPLLRTISKNPTYAVTPEIDVIDHKLFSIHRATDNIGVLDFKSFSFKWTGILPRIKKALHYESEPIPSPTMAGGIYAIKKDFFVSLGMYDPGLQLWGGENIELSLKLWLCGGGILIQPCSRVAHVFRDTSPYLKGEKVQIAINNAARVAHVWADDYRKFFFKEIKIKDVTAWPNILKNVEERMELREKLKCKTFSWYLENVYPELHIESSGKYLGQIKSSSGLCINRAKTSSESPLVLGDCHYADSWEYSRIGEIRGFEKCIGFSPEENRLFAKSCDLQTNTQLFQYTEENILYHPTSQMCLTLGEDGLSVVLGRCHKNLDLFLEWQWPQNTDYIPYIADNIYYTTKDGFTE